MNGLTTITELLKRVRRKPAMAASVIAGLLFLASVSAPAKAQGTNTYTGMTVVHEGTLGLVPGQTVSVSVPNFCFADGSVKFLKHTIKVYAVTERESGLVYSGESGGINEHELGHIFTLGRGNIPLPGDLLTGRVQLWIKIESFLPLTTKPVRNLETWSPSVELIDDANGRTVLIGLLLPAVQKVRD